MTYTYAKKKQTNQMEIQGHLPVSSMASGVWMPRRERSGKRNHKLLLVLTSGQLGWGAGIVATMTLRNYYVFYRKVVFISLFLSVTRM